MRGRRSGLAVLGASLALASGAMAESTAPSATKAVAPGVDVAAVQRALGITADGIVGPQTRRAIRRFQRANGLVVDGIVGPQTLAALGLSTGSSTKVKPAEAGTAAVLARIAECESGGDPKAVSADGRYRGKYQFSRATWRAMGGRGDPAKAPEAEQDRLAAELLAASGTSPWPSCA